MPLAVSSVHKEALWTAATTAVGEQVSVQSSNTNAEKLAPFVWSMLSTSADLLVTSVRQGGNLTPAAAGALIVGRAAGFAGLSDNEKVQCFGALVSLATSGAQMAGVLGASAAAEIGSAGAATPAVAAISTPMLIATSAAFALSASAAHQQCGPLVSRFFSDQREELFKVYLDFNKAIGHPAP